MKEIVMLILKALVEIFLAGLSKGNCGSCSPS